MVKLFGLSTLSLSSHLLSGQCKLGLTHAELALAVRRAIEQVLRFPLLAHAGWHRKNSLAGSADPQTVFVSNAATESSHALSHFCVVRGYP